MGGAIMVGLVRKETWAADLTAYLATIAARPLVPGEHDCVMFAAGAVEAMMRTSLTSPDLWTLAIVVKPKPPKSRCCRFACQTLQVLVASHTG